MMWSSCFARYDDLSHESTSYAWVSWFYFCTLLSGFSIGRSILTASSPFESGKSAPCSSPLSLTFRPVLLLPLPNRILQLPLKLMPMPLAANGVDMQWRGRVSIAWLWLTRQARCITCALPSIYFWRFAPCICLSCFVSSILTQRESKIFIIIFS